MYGYTVTVKHFNVKTGEDRTTKIRFFSAWAARVKAKDYFTCWDVESVEVICDDTGELIYYHDAKEEWDSEG